MVVHSASSVNGVVLAVIKPVGEFDGTKSKMTRLCLDALDRNEMIELIFPNVLIRTSISEKIQVRDKDKL